MGLFLIILLVIWLAIVIFRKPLGRWFAGMRSRIMEDLVRRMMGMPSRKEEKRRARQASNESTRGSRSRNGGNRRRGGRRSPDAAEMMHSVAVDVEYTEIKEFDSTVIAEESSEGTRTVTEEQVSDVEFTEIKTKH